MKKNSKNKELANVSIASPCSADWNQMRGDEKQRFCDQCSLFVYDISAMSADEAEDFLAKNQKVCLSLMHGFQKSAIDPN